ncbi:hypothetical protein COV94_05185, partial [Candidatus Woesearchaeota archaeon CG11_big_fil_rev_8_21_14_0_20_57_5]
LSDTHCGLRVIKADLLSKLHLKETGMEFAIELLAKAAACDTRIIEVPIQYRRRATRSKLHPLRDGLRHARFLLRSTRQSTQ